VRIRFSNSKKLGSNFSEKVGEEGLSIASTAKESTYPSKSYFLPEMGRGKKVVPEKSVEKSGGKNVESGLISSQKDWKGSKYNKTTG